MDLKITLPGNIYHFVHFKRIKYFSPCLAFHFMGKLNIPSSKNWQLTPTPEQKEP